MQQRSSNQKACDKTQQVKLHWKNSPKCMLKPDGINIYVAQHKTSNEHQAKSHLPQATHHLPRTNRDGNTRQLCSNTTKTSTKHLSRETMPRIPTPFVKEASRIKGPTQLPPPRQHLNIFHYNIHLKRKSLEDFIISRFPQDPNRSVPN